MKRSELLGPLLDPVLGPNLESRDRAIRVCFTIPLISCRIVTMLTSTDIKELIFSSDCRLVKTFELLEFLRKFLDDSEHMIY